MLGNGRASDLALLGSTCISSVALASVYQRGRHEKLHSFAVILAVWASTVIFNRTELPPDVLVFGVFPWTIAAALFASRICDPLLKETIMIPMFSEKQAYLEKEVYLDEDEDSQCLESSSSTEFLAGLG